MQSRLYDNNPILKFLSHMVSLSSEATQSMSLKSLCPLFREHTQNYLRATHDASEAVVTMITYKSVSSGGGSWRRDGIYLFNVHNRGLHIWGQICNIN